MFTPVKTISLAPDDIACFADINVFETVLLLLAPLAKGIVQKVQL